jgi:hypothetical protein
LAEVEVRSFEVDAPPPESPVEHEHVHLVDESPLELNLAAVIQRNALAVPYRGSLLMRLVGREMALVVSLFGHTPPGVPLTRHRAFDSSSLHIRRFTTEVFALGSLTAAVSRNDDALKPVAHFDILPQHLRHIYPQHRVRPDLRFASGNTVLAGEARGRSSAAPIHVLTSKSQRRRLYDLLDWSRQPGCDPVCMAWSWMQRWHTVIDFFRFRQDVTTEPIGEIELQELESAAGITHEDDPIEVASPIPGYKSGRDREFRAKERIIEKLIEDREDQLAETAPESPIIELNHRWFGEWFDVPTFDGTPSPKLLIASSKGKREPSVLSSAPDLLDASKDEAVEVALDGRTMFAIDWSGKRNGKASSEAVERLVRRKR